MTSVTSAAMAFDVPAHRFATAPPEVRGIRRDEVKLLVAAPRRMEHTTFTEIGNHLAPGDLLVVNTSPTLPAAVDGLRNTGPVTVHFSTRLGPGRWIVELRRPDRSGPVVDADQDDEVMLPEGGRLWLGAPVASGGELGGTRLWNAVLRLPIPLSRYLERFGAPIRYSYVDEAWPLESYQTVFATHKRRGQGSAEMVSAARPFSHPLVTELVSKGIRFAPITLHAGVSSPGAGELPQPEWFDVPRSTAQAVAAARRAGSRVIAVGTTVTRALATVGAGEGRIRAASGWTDVVLDGSQRIDAVDGLVTGWHEADASHLRLLESVAGPELVLRAYQSALAADYLWHEFGDSCLLLRHPR